MGTNTKADLSSTGASEKVTVLSVAVDNLITVYSYPSHVPCHNVNLLHMLTQYSVHILTQYIPKTSVWSPPLDADLGITNYYASTYTTSHRHSVIGIYIPTPLPEPVPVYLFPHNMCVHQYKVTPGPCHRVPIYLHLLLLQAPPAAHNN